MKITELMAKDTPLAGKGDEAAWQNNARQAADTHPVTVSYKKAYWILGKNKEGKDRKWGPFNSSSDAQKMKASRTDIRNARVVYENKE